MIYPLNPLPFLYTFIMPLIAPSPRRIGPSLDTEEIGLLVLAPVHVNPQDWLTRINHLPSVPRLTFLDCEDEIVLIGITP